MLFQLLHDQLLSDFSSLLILLLWVTLPEPASKSLCSDFVIGVSLLVLDDDSYFHIPYEQHVYILDFASQDHVLIMEDGLNWYHTARLSIRALGCPNGKATELFLFKLSQSRNRCCCCSTFRSHRPNPTQTSVLLRRIQHSPIVGTWFSLSMLKWHRVYKIHRYQANGVAATQTVLLLSWLPYASLIVSFPPILWR
jgi:hypothetical protein